MDVSLYNQSVAEDEGDAPDRCRGTGLEKHVIEYVRTGDPIAEHCGEGVGDCRGVRNNSARVSFAEAQRVSETAGRRAHSLRCLLRAHEQPHSAAERRASCVEPDRPFPPRLDEYVAPVLDDDFVAEREQVACDRLGDSSRHGRQRTDSCQQSRRCHVLHACRGIVAGYNRWQARRESWMDVEVLSQFGAVTGD